MRALLLFVVLGLGAPGAMAQPADCLVRAPAAPAQRVTIGLAGRPGVPPGAKGRATIDVPMAAPQTECGEPSAPSDVLGGAPGDLLRGTPAPAQVGR